MNGYLPKLDRVFLFQFVFVATGVVQTIGSQYAFYQGAAEKSTMLPLIANFLGTSLAFFIPLAPETSTSISKEGKTVIPHQKLLLVAVFECLGNACALIGIIYAGSGLYQVVYSFVVIMTAIFSKIFLKKALTFNQWVAICIICAGLGLSAFGAHDSKTTADETKSQIIGIAATLASCTVFALNYVLIESIISAPTAPPSQVIQGYAGAYSLGLISIYVALHTLPNWHVLVTENVAKSHGNWTFIAFVYLGKTCAAFFHSYSYYKLVSLVGAVSTGVLQSLRAVSVFLISAVLFCGLHHEQCYNMMKAISTLVVVGGLYYFSHLKLKELKKTTARLELPIQNSNGNVQM